MKNQARNLKWLTFKIISACNNNQMNLDKSNFHFIQSQKIYTKSPSPKDCNPKISREIIFYRRRSMVIFYMETNPKKYSKCLKL